MPDDPTKKLFSSKPSQGVCAELRVADVLALRPTWSEAEAAGFLHACAPRIASAMLRAGTVELAYLIRLGEHFADKEDQQSRDEPST